MVNPMCGAAAMSLSKRNVFVKQRPGGLNLLLTLYDGSKDKEKEVQKNTKNS